MWSAVAKGDAVYLVTGFIFRIPPANVSAIREFSSHIDSTAPHAAWLDAGSEKNPRNLLLTAFPLPPSPMAHIRADSSPGVLKGDSAFRFHSNAGIHSNPSHFGRLALAVPRLCCGVHCGRRCTRRLPSPL